MGTVSGVLAVLLASEEGASGGVSMFTPQLGLIAWTWIVFVILLWALSKLAWPMILGLTEKRERTIADSLAEAARLNAEAKANAAEQAKLLAEARTQSSAFLATARAQAEKETAAALATVKVEQEEMIARARRDIVAERERAVAEIRAEAVELSLAAASKLIGQKLDSAADREIVTAYIASIGAK
jgi:F-type H+-transporting ATPase subunit b